MEYLELRISSAKTPERQHPLDQGAAAFPTDPLLSTPLGSLMQKPCSIMRQTGFWTYRFGHAEHEGQTAPQFSSFLEAPFSRLVLVLLSAVCPVRSQDRFQPTNTLGSTLFQLRLCGPPAEHSGHGLNALKQTGGSSLCTVRLPSFSRRRPDSGT